MHRKGGKPFFVKLMNLSARFVEPGPDGTNLTSVLEQVKAMLRASGLKTQDIIDVIQKRGAIRDANMLRACFSVKSTLGTVGKIAGGIAGKIALGVIAGML